MRALSPLPLALAGASILIIVGLGAADIALTVAHTQLPMAIRQWILWAALTLGVLTAVTIAARWIVDRIEQSVSRMTSAQVQAVCDDPLLSETIAAIAIPHVKAWSSQNSRHLRVVGNEDD